MTRFFQPAPPRVLAHRGLALGVPENTLASFQKAVDAGGTHVETDVHVSRDGVAIVSHDPTLARVAHLDKAVADLTAAELARVDLGGGVGFTPLADALDAFPDTCFNIDIKTAGAADPAVEAITRTNAIDRVLITSFSTARRLAVVRQLPGVATSISASGAVPSVVWANAGWTGRVARILRDVRAVQFPTRLLGMPTMTPRTIAAYHAAGVEVHVWTINDPAEMTALLDLGVDGLVTDRADLALPLVAARH